MARTFFGLSTRKFPGTSGFLLREPSVFPLETFPLKMRVPFQASHEERGTNETGALPELLLSFEVSERFW